MKLQVNLSVLTVHDIFVMKEALRQYDTCDGVDDQTQYELYEAIRKITFTEIRE